MFQLFNTPVHIFPISGGFVDREELIHFFRTTQSSQCCHFGIAEVVKSKIITPANEVCEGYVFTPVCQSFCSRGGCVVGGMHGRGACVVGACVLGGVRGRGMHGEVCMAGGHAWQGDMHGSGACVAGGMHAMHAPPSRYYQIW